MTRSVIKCVVAALFVALLTLAAAQRASHGQMMTLGAGGGGAGGSTCGNHDPDFSDVVLLVGNDSAANGSTTFVDQSNKANSISIGSGTVAYSNAQAPSGLSTSIQFTAGGLHPYLVTPSSTAFQFGSGNWTVEGFVYGPTVNSAEVPFVTRWTANGTTNTDWDVEANSGLFTQVSTSGTGFTLSETDGAISNNTWTHFAIYDVSGTLYGAVNGTVTQLAASIGTLFASTNPLTLGGFSQNACCTIAGSTVGYMASIRITKGVARYGSSNFTPPSLPLPSC
jgi:Concanavalin A-like lectin/glucanases superfamily